MLPRYSLKPKRYEIFASECHISKMLARQKPWEKRNIVIRAQAGIQFVCFLDSLVSPMLARE
ncbi:hypothetical protein ASZ90_006906 [hydrocarbon metagenome]|uniref:Uncharacterized protein n=1 Tax=hydrocarbon metagenome TaxID=938273 RepID=A0A0W8FQN0_9ZZZZ